MDKRFIPVATLVGALALAGCGGGSDTPAAATVPSMPEGMDDKSETSGADTTAAGGATAGLDGKRLAAGNVDRVIRIPATGKETKIEDVYFTCAEGPEDCVITIPAGESVHTVSYTGGTLTASATKAPPETSDPPETGNWLSASSLVGALDADGDAYGIKVGNVNVNIEPADADDVSSANPAGSVAFGDVDDDAHGDPKVTGLRLYDNRTPNNRDFLVWGVWKEPVAGSAPDKPHQVSGGSMAHGKPTRTIGSATYTGTALGHVTGITGVTEWDGTASLTADFEDQLISGSIAPTTAELLAEIASIELGNASIDASLSGTATIRGLGAPRNRDTGFGNLDDRSAFTRNAPSSGTWTGAFYGPTSGDPTGVAGSFSVKRDKAPQSSGAAHAPGTWHDAVGALSVSGAFGADCTGAACGSP